MLPQGATDDGRGMLTIRNVKRTDAGNYVCTLSTRTGDYSDTGSLRVIGEPPKATITPSTQTILLGERAEFNCVATGEPPPVITWGFGHPGGPLRPGVIQENGRLIIPSVEQRDEGKYFCQASNVVQTVTDQATLFVNKELPKIRIEPVKEKKLRQGDSFQFRCIATGIPKPQVDWTGPNGERLQEGRVRDMGDGILEISDFKEEDVGRYTCTAFNQAGTATDFADVGSSKKIFNYEGDF